MKFPTSATITIGVYDAKIHVFAAKYGWTTSLVDQWLFHNYQMVADDSDNDNSEAYGLTLKIKPLTFGIFLSKKAKLQTLAHECLHLTLGIMKDIGVNTISEEEPFCYLHQSIIYEVADFLKLKQRLDYKSPQQGLK